MQATVPPLRPLAPSIQAYLNFCRVEKGLAANSLNSYQLDLKRLSQEIGKPVTNVQSFREALNKADPKRGVLLYLDRKGNKTFAVLKAGNS